MALLGTLVTRLRRRPVDPERALAQAQAEACRRTQKERFVHRAVFGHGPASGGGGGY